MIGIVLALLSAATSGLSVVLVRRHLANSSAFNMSLIITIVGMVLLWPLALVLTDFSTVSLAGIALFALSGLLSPGLVRLLYYQGMKKLGASVNSSVYAAYPLYSTLLAVVFLSEVLSVWNGLGIFVILLGIILIEMITNGNGGEGNGGWRTLIFPILGGITLGISSIIRKIALNVNDTPVFGVAVAYIFSLLPYLLMITSTPTIKNFVWKKNLRWFWVAGIGQAVTWMIAFYALSFEQVSIITPLLSMEPVFVVIFGYLCLRNLEHVSLKLIACITLTILGVALIAL